MGARHAPWRGAALACALLLAAAAGCSGDDDPSQSPTPPASGTSSPASPTPSATGESATPTPTPSASVVVPAAAQKHTFDGGEAFARYYVEVGSAGYAAMDSSSLRALSDVSCGGCQAIIQDIDQQEEDGLHPA